MLTEAKEFLLGTSALQNVNLVNDQEQSHRREDDEKDEKTNHSLFIICKMMILRKEYQMGGIYGKDTMYRNGCVSSMPERKFSNYLTKQHHLLH